MNLINQLTIQKFHEAKIELYGSGNAKSLAWHSSEGQLKRFEVLSQIGDLNNASILDLGCGNGDLCMYLNERVENLDYHGIDFVQEFLDNAIERNKNCSKIKFYYADFMAGELLSADFVFASGSLNYKNSNPDFIFNAILKLYAHCNIALGFNLLSKPVSNEGILVSYSPEAIITYCKTLSSNVVLKEGYEEGDFTVMVYKKE